MKNQKSKIKNFGFTLVELVIVASIIVTLLGFITISLVSSQQAASLTSAEEVLISDLKQQQLKSMIGDTEGRSLADSYGVHFESNRYILFHGAAYSPLDAFNVTINLDENTQFKYPLTDVVFSRLSGEITQDTVVELQDSTNSKSKKIHLNKYGVIIQAESL